MSKLIESAAIAPDTLTGKSWRIKIIEGDKQGSSAYYPKEALQEGAKLFAPKTKIYLNHPTEDDKFNIPARRVQDIVGYLSEGATYEGKDLYANATFLPKFQEDIKALAEAGLIGMSIRADGELTESKGVKTLKRFTRVDSVDVVTSPGAGGGFDTLLESATTSVAESGTENQRKEESIMDPKLVEALAALAEATKANQEAIAGLTEVFSKATSKTAAAKKEDAADGGADDDEEDADGNLIKGKKKAPVKESFAAIDAALTEAKLPAVSRASVFAAVEAGAKLEEAVKSEVEKVTSILEEAGSRFGGGNLSEDGTEKSPKAQLEEAAKNVFR
jgi:hypothetical protein